MEWVSIVFEVFMIVLLTVIIGLMVRLIHYRFFTQSKPVYKQKSWKGITYTTMQRVQ